MRLSSADKSFLVLVLAVAAWIIAVMVKISQISGAVVEHLAQ